MSIFDLFRPCDCGAKFDAIATTLKEQARLMSDVLAKAAELKKDTERALAALAAVKAELETLKAQIDGNAAAQETLAKVEAIIDSTDADVEAAVPEPVEPPPPSE